MSRTDTVLLSESSLKSAAENMISKYGSHAWGMADAKLQSLTTEGLHSFAATWQQIRDAIETFESRTSETERPHEPVLGAVCLDHPSGTIEIYDTLLVN